MADANRTISIRMILEDQDFKTKMKSLSNDMNLFRSELTQIESKYIGQQNTLAALTEKYAVYQNMLNTVNERTKTLADRNVQLKQALQDIQATREKNNQSIEEYTKKLEDVEKILPNYKLYHTAINETFQTSKVRYQEAQKALEEFEKKYEGTTRNFPWYKKKHEELTKAVEEAKQENDKWKQSLVASGERINKTVQEGENYRKSIKDLKDDLTSLDNQERDVGNAISDTTAKMNRSQAEANKLATTAAQLKTGMDDCEKSGKNVTAMFDPFSGKMKEAKDTANELADALVLKLVQEGFNVVKEAVTGSIDAFKEYETALAGVSKTTGMEWGGEEIKSLGEDFKQLSLELPVSAKELLNVAQIAGQLGIQGSEDIQKFTKVMAQMSVSTNLSAEEAATAMAQMAAVTGMAASDYDKLGSAVVALGNKFPTSEDVIIRIAQRFSGAATNASLAESSIVALAAAAGSVGLQAESAGTSLSKLIQKMGTAVESEDELATWAEVANMQAEDFARLWGEDASQAVAKFMEGFGRLGPKATATFKELGIGEARLQDLIRRMSNAEATSHLLSRALEEANDAFAEGVALENEANVAFGTLNSQTEILKNSVNVLSTEVGAKLAPQVTKLVEGATDITNAITDIIKKDPGLVYVLEGITAIIGVLTIDYLAKTVPLLKNTIDMFKGLAEVLTVENLASKFTNIANGVVTFTSSLASMLPVLLAVGAAFSALYFLSKYGDYDSTDALTKKTEEYTESLKSRAEVEDELKYVLAKLHAAQNKYKNEVERTGMASEKTENDISELTAAYNALLAILEQMPEATEEATEAEETFAYTTTENTQKIKALTSAFADNISKVKDFSTEYTATAKSYIEGIEQQIKWHDTYAQNREKLLSRDIEGLVEWVATWDNGTEEAAKKMAAFAGATDEQLKYIISVLLPELAESASENATTAENEFKEAWDNIYWYAKDKVADIQLAIDSLHGKEILIKFKHDGVSTTYDAINAQGLDYVPYDGFVSMLHEGEKVLNRAEASAYRKLERTTTNNTTNNNNNVTLYVYGAKGQSADEISDIVMKKIQDATNRRSAVWA